MERTCKKCGETKLIEKFKKDKTCINGRTYTCNDCSNLYSKEYKRRNNYKYKERIRFYDKNRPHQKERNRKYYSRHKKVILGKVKEYYVKNKERRILKINEWKRHNKGMLTERNHKLINEIADSYVVLKIYHLIKISSTIIRLHPDLIERFRQEIKLKRLLKQKKNENSKTS